jgi:hypothetical protein
MPEASQYTFTHKEIAEMLVKHAGLHDGKWMLQVTFAFGAANAGPAPEQIIPSAFAGVQTIGLQKAAADAPVSLTVDAAEVNPSGGAKKKKS